MINITLDFDKRFEGKIPDAATYPGIYAVWAYKDEGGDSKWVLLDVGQAKNMADRHATHERKPQWLKYAKDNAMKLIYYTAEINNDHNYRDIAEAALIYNFQPKCPTDGKEGYHHEDVKVSVIGYLQKAFGEFTVRNTDK